MTACGLRMDSDGIIRSITDDDYQKDYERTGRRGSIAAGPLPPSPPSSKNASPPKGEPLVPSPRRVPPNVSHASDDPSPAPPVSATHSAPMIATSPIPIDPRQNVPNDMSSRPPLFNNNEKRDSYLPPARSTSLSEKSVIRDRPVPTHSSCIPEEPAEIDHPALPGIENVARAVSPPVPAVARVILEEAPPERPISPPVPALARSLQGAPLSTGEEFPSDPPPAIGRPSKPPKSTKRPVVQTISKAPRASSPPAPPRPFKSPLPAQPVSPSSNISNRLALPPGFENPEPIPEHLMSDYALPNDAFGQLLIRCLLGKQFGLREWAMGEIMKMVEERATKGKGRLKADDSVDINTFVEAVYQIIQASLGDSREKVVTGGIALWERVTRTWFAYRNSSVNMRTNWFVIMQRCVLASGLHRL